MPASMKIQVNARNRAYHLEMDKGARILHAGLAAGVHLPYECGSGTCGHLFALYGGEGKEVETPWSVCRTDTDEEIVSDAKSLLDHPQMGSCRR